mmetsp:Transcript_30614/g.71197  ORF Transcript_30614/g.71197 Transcript_30614/m.71197 type:complete len:102 (-) Transcript_30614:304-609(-)
MLELPARPTAENEGEPVTFASSERALATGSVADSDDDASAAVAGGVTASVAIAETEPGVTDAPTKPKPLSTRGSGDSCSGAPSAAAAPSALQEVSAPAFVC